MPMRSRNLVAVAIPQFQVTLKNGSRSKTVSAGIDTGMETADIEIPQSLATELAITPVKFAQVADTTQVFQQSMGVIDELSIPSMSGCSLKKAVVAYSSVIQGILVGDNFLKSVGASVSYETGSPVMACTLAAADRSSQLAPAFNVSLINGQKIYQSAALFDTGFTGDVTVTQELAAQLGLKIKGYETATTHSGTVQLGLAALDRLVVKDLPGCFATGLTANVVPASAPLQNMLVGESFLSKVSGAVGYDNLGAYFMCKASDPQKARPVALTRVPDSWLPGVSNDTLIAVAGAVGLVAVGGVLMAVLGGNGKKQE